MLEHGNGRSLMEPLASQPASLSEVMLTYNASGDTSWSSFRSKYHSRVVESPLYRCETDVVAANPGLPMATVRSAFSSIVVRPAWYEPMFQFSSSSVPVNKRIGRSIDRECA